MERSRPSRAVTGAAVTVLALTMMLAIGLSDRYVPAVSDWYSQVVIRYMPEGALYFTTRNDDRAFYLCARSVVRQIEDETSVVTFASHATTSTLALGDGRFRVESYVDEAIEDGPTYRRPFTCTVKQEGSSWRLEDVDLEDSGPAMRVTAAD